MNTRHRVDGVSDGDRYCGEWLNGPRHRSHGDQRVDPSAAVAVSQSTDAAPSCLPHRVRASAGIGRRHADVIRRSQSAVSRRPVAPDGDVIGTVGGVVSLNTVVTGSDVGCTSPTRDRGQRMRAITAVVVFHRISRVPSYPPRQVAPSSN